MSNMGKAAFSLAQKNTLDLANKIKTAIFTATVANTTNCIHGISGYDNNHDELVVIDMYSGHLCSITSEYTENINLLSIDLVSWSIGIGESIKFILYKNIK